MERNVKTINVLNVEELRDEFANLLADAMKKVREQEENERLLTSKEVCDILGISRPTLDSWVRRGFLAKAYGSERKIYYKKGEVMETLNSRKKGGSYE